MSAEAGDGAAVGEGSSGGGEDVEASREIQVSIDRSGQTLSRRELTQILSSLSTVHRMPRPALQVLERFLESPPDRLLQQRSTLQIESAGVVITVKLPVAHGNRKGADVFPTQRAVLGPDKRHLYLSLGQFRVPGRVDAQPTVLARLELPLKTGNKMEVLWTDPADQWVLDCEWFTQGFCVLAEYEGGRNWARMMDWSGQLLWSLCNNDMPGVQYLDFITELPDRSYLLICTMEDDSAQFLTWDAEARTLAQWRHHEAIASFLRELSGHSLDRWMKTLVLPIAGADDGASTACEAIFLGHYDEEVAPPEGADEDSVEEVLHCIVCHCRWSEEGFEVIAQRDLGEIFAEQASLAGGYITVSPRAKGTNPHHLLLLDGHTLQQKEDLTITFHHQIEDPDDDGLGMEVPFFNVIA